MEQPEGALPETPFEWGPTAEQNNALYGQAACKTLQWLEANGSIAGLLGNLRRTAATGVPATEG